MALKQIAAATALLILMTPATVNAGSSFEGLTLAPQFYYRLAQCETGRNWKHETKSYTSGFGIAKGVWQRFSNSSSATRYTPREQAIVADRIMFLGFTNETGFKPPVGAYGFGTVKNNCMNLQYYICKSRRAVVARFKRGC